MRFFSEMKAEGHGMKGRAWSCQAGQHGRSQSARQIFEVTEHRRRRQKHELTSENTAGEEKLSEDPCQQPAGRGGERVCVG